MACNATALALATDACALARVACGDVGSGKFGSYVVHWYCTFGQWPVFVLPLGLWLLMFMLALCSTADTFLIPQLNYISDLLKLKPDVAGVTLLAFGNGAADVFTGIAVVMAHPDELDFSLMLSYQIGATIFIMTVVVGVVIWVAAEHAPGWRLSRMPFFRDSICFVVAVTLVLAMASGGKVFAWQAVFLLLLYFVYVALVILLRYYIQPYWPDDTFGVFVAAKAQPALRRAEALRRRAAPLARRAQVAAAPISRKLRPATEFLQVAGESLLRATDHLAGGPPPAAAPTQGSSTHDVPTSSPLVRDAAAHSPNGGAGLGASPEASGPEPLQSLQPLSASPATFPTPPPSPPDGAPLQLMPTGDAHVSVSGFPTPPTMGDTGGEAAEAGLLDEVDDGGLEGLDYPADGSHTTKALWMLEMPLSYMRWATIPSDGEWDARRRYWSTLTPPFALALFSVEYNGGLVESWPWIFVLPLLASPRARHTTRPLLKPVRVYGK